MSDEIDHECVVCGGTDGLIPLYADKAPDARPVAWVHAACLADPEKDDDDSEE
jgi:hypothetical protein